MLTCVSADVHGEFRGETFKLNLKSNFQTQGGYMDTKTYTITEHELKGLMLMLDAGSRVVNNKMYNACREAAEKGELSAEVKEFGDWRKGQFIARNFFERISNDKSMP